MGVPRTVMKPVIAGTLPTTVMPVAVMTRLLTAIVLEPVLVPAVTVIILEYATPTVLLGRESGVSVGMGLIVTV